MTATLVFLGRRALDWDGRAEDGELTRSGIRQTRRRWGLQLILGSTADIAIFFIKPGEQCQII